MNNFKLIDDDFETETMFHEYVKLSLKEKFQKKMQERRQLTDELQKIKEENIITKSRTELRELAVRKGVKGANRLNMKTLCAVLNIPLSKNETFDKFNKEAIKTPVKITLTAEDGVKIEFPSIYNAAACLKKNPSCISFFIRKKLTVKFKDKNWIVSR